MKKIITFAQDHEASAIVDWIILGAGVLALGFAIIATVSQT